MGGKDVLYGWFQVCRVLVVTKGDSLVLLLSVSRLLSTVLGVAGEEVIQWERELIEGSVVCKLEERNGVEPEEGRLPAVVDLVSSLGSDSVLENVPSEEVAEMAPGTPDVAKGAMVSDTGDVNVLARMVSAEDSVSVCR